MQDLRHSRRLFLTLAALLLAAPGFAAGTPLDPARVKAIAAVLPERPGGAGRPLSDRAAWEALGAQPAYRALVARAGDILKQPLPEQPDDLYLEFSRNGNRTRWQAVASARRGRLTPLVLAECLENTGRFVPAIEQLIAAVCAERTWVMPAHDAKLANFHGTTIDIDLASSALGWNLAVADYLLGERLGAAARRQLRDNVKRRVLAPYRAMFTGRRPADWWLTGTNNWNAVCLAGVTGAGLAQIASRQERAEYVAAAEKYSRHFLSGFTPDGYCSEGLGYWNYGFGHYVLLSETIHRATGGKVDLLAVPEARLPAAFGARIQIMNGVSPAFADCSVNARPAPAVMYLISRRLGLDLPGYDRLDPKDTFGSLFEATLYGFPGAAAPAAGKGGAAPGPARRDWFDKAGILIGRPAPGSACRLGVALKGGHNAEHHNHNDLGSYVVVRGERPVLLDPGSETYTARTFSPRRYESKLLSSFGHPVPLPAKTLQRAGREAEARVLGTDFRDTADTLRLDLTAAYPVPDLKDLRRTFVYSRQGDGSLAVTDHVAFKRPRPFGTAVLTLGSWQRQPDGSLLVFDVDQALRVEVDAGGREFTVDAEEIREDAPVVPTRLGINLKEPVTEASVTLKITPFSPPAPPGGGLLPNGGFEISSWGWELPKNGMGALSAEKAAGGQTSLKISDRDRQGGSNVSSARLPAAAGRYTLRGKVFHVSGDGIGMYVRCLNARREMINPVTGPGNIAPVGTVTGADGKWEPFAFHFQTPPDTTLIQLWIHSFNGAEVEAYLDELEIVPD